jgi:hypothetical protein
MYRVDAPNNAITIPTPTALGAEEYFEDGTVGGDGTLLDADFLNSVQESLVALLTDQSVGHSKTDASKILEAFTSLADRALEDAVEGARGYISGLLTEVTGPTTIEISPGFCRDRLNTNYMKLTGANVQKDFTIAWNTGTGGRASTLNLNLLNAARLFAIGKAPPSLEIDFGVDSHEHAANLLSDAAASGFTTARQVGWVVWRLGFPNSIDLINLVQDAFDPDFWRLRDLAVNTDKINVGEKGQSGGGFVHFAPDSDSLLLTGTVTIQADADPADRVVFHTFGNIDGNNPPSDNTTSPPFANADWHSQRTMIKSADPNLDNISFENVIPVLFAPLAVFQVNNSTSAAGANITYTSIGEGFRWDRRQT